MRKRQKHVSKKENGQTRSSSTSLVDYSTLLPIDLLSEIFSRSSMETIGRLRCVSKHLCSILKRSDFIHVLRRKYSASPHLLFTFELNGKWCFFSSPQPQNPDMDLSLIAVDHRMSFPTRTGSYRINAPVGGLLCTKGIWLQHGYNGLKSMVYNPSTGQSITLPQFGTMRDNVRLMHLGFDPINKQVKVLCISISRKPCKAKEYQVLTLGTEKPSWRKIECSIPYLPSDTGICINGVLYYLVDPNNRFPKPKVTKPYTVVCFDVKSEKFTFIDNGPDSEIKWCATLINYNSKLGVLRQDYDGFFSGTTRRLELWVLNGVRGQLLKQIYLLPYLWENIVGDTKLNVVGMTSNGELVFSPIVLSDPFYIFFYNVRTRTVRRVRIQGIGPVSGQKIYTFIDHIEDMSG